MIYIIRFSDLKCIKQYNLEYASHAEISKDGKYLLIGTWESGYCIEMKDVVNDVQNLVAVNENKQTKMLHEKGLTKELLAEIPDDYLSEVLATYALEGGVDISCLQDQLLNGLLVFYLTWWTLIFLLRI